MGEESWSEFLASAASEDQQPEVRVLAAEGSRELLEAMDGLEERDRRVLTLKYWAELSHKEITELMEIDANHVGVLLKRAKDRLKKKIEK